MKDVIDILYYDFLTNPPEELEALHKENEALDVEAMRVAFAAGYAAAQRVQEAKYRLAVRNQQRAQETA